MNNKLYLECYSGISGDMLVASLLDLGANPKVLLEVLNSVKQQEGMQEFSIKISSVKKAGLNVCDFDVILSEECENHDHDMKYLYGSENTDSHNMHVHPGHHIHRGLKDVKKIIEYTNMTERARKTAEKVFQILAEAEAKAHGTSVEKVHFHEVGAIDSIVDVISAAVCLDNLNITETIVPVLYEGNGTVRCQHGVLPVPVPAVTNIVSNYALPLHMTERKGELVTPTGAAIAAAITTSEELPDRYQIIKTGIGAGKREYEQPSLLRAMLIQENMDKQKQDEYIYKLESNIDDCTGEALGYCMERLLREGARDVHYLPVFMKKNRPAYQLNVICKKCDIEKMEQIIFEETTTIGIRRQKMERTVLDRSVHEVDTSFGRIHVKECKTKDFTRNYPEYDDIVKICRETGVSYQQIYNKIRAELEN